MNREKDQTPSQGSTSPVEHPKRTARGGATHEAAVSGKRSGTLPPPLVSPVVVLRDFQYMPLDVVRLRDSSLAAKATGEEFRCAVLLWCASWHQIPAGSLPADDDELCQLAGFGRALKDWLKVRPGALRGWVTCSDGRMYHPVVSEKAREAWIERLKQRWKTECARIKKASQRDDHAPKYPTFDEWMTHFEATGSERWQGSAPRSVSRGTAKGQRGDVPQKFASKGREGKGREAKPREGKGFPTGDIQSNNTSADTAGEQAADLARVLRAMGWSECADGHPELVKAKALGITAAQLQAAAVGKAGKPISYVVGRAIGMRDDAAAQSGSGGNVVHIKTAEQQQADEVALLRRELEDKMLQAQNDFRLGVIDQAERDRRIADYREAIEGLEPAAGAAKEARS